MPMTCFIDDPNLCQMWPKRLHRALPGAPGENWCCRGGQQQSICYAQHAWNDLALKRTYSPSCAPSREFCEERMKSS